MVPPTRAVLEKSGVEIEANPDDVSKLPQYVEDLRRHLLNFRGIIPRTVRKDLIDLCEYENEGLEVDEKPPDTIYRDTDHQSYLERWNKANTLRHRSRDVINRSRENHWDELFGKYLFKDLFDQCEEKGIRLRDLLSWGKNEQFCNNARIRDCLSDGCYHAPKSDLWFGLGFCKDKHIERLQGLETEDKGIKYFTHEIIAKLAQGQGPRKDERLICQPADSIKNGGFPWLIAELKHETNIQKEQECLNQAANGSHFSMKLCEHLAKPTGKPVLPIIAMTFIGPKAKVWIFHKCEEAGNPQYRMSCIWANNSEHIWGAVQLQTIVDQAMFWALRMFKPWVTECLEYWNTEPTAPDAQESSSVNLMASESETGTEVKENRSDSNLRVSVDGTSGSGPSSEGREHESDDEANRHHGKRGYFARRFFPRRPKFLRRGRRARSREPEQRSISSRQTSMESKPKRKDRQTQTLPLGRGKDRQNQTPIDWMKLGQPVPKPKLRSTKDEGSQTSATSQNQLDSHSKDSSSVPKSIWGSNGPIVPYSPANSIMIPHPRLHSPQTRPRCNIRVHLPPVPLFPKTKVKAGLDDPFAFPSDDTIKAEAEITRARSNSEPLTPTIANVNEDTKDRDEGKGNEKETHTALAERSIKSKSFEPVLLPVRPLATPPRHVFFGPNAIRSDEAVEALEALLHLGPPESMISGNLSRPRSTSDIAGVQREQQQQQQQQERSLQEQGQGGSEQGKVLDDDGDLADRLHVVRARTKAASTQALVLASRTQVLVQRMVMEQVRLFSSVSVSLPPPRRSAERAS